MAAKTEKHTIDRLVDGQMWVEQLLNLFWDVDEVVKDRPETVEPHIMAAYQRAERARQELS